MEKVLVISSNKKASETLVNFLRESFGCSIRLAESKKKKKTIEIAEYIIKNTAANCILIIKEDDAEKLSSSQNGSGIIFVGKPFSKSLLYQLIKTVDIAVTRSLKLYHENLRLEQKITEIQTIDKAKFMLMQYRDMTEDEAHSYVEQYAMNKRKKKSIAALEIIDKLSEKYL